MTAEEIRQRYMEAKDNGAVKEKAKGKELIQRVMQERYAQIEIFRMHFIIGCDTFIAYVHEYTNKMIRDPVYKDISETVFAPEWYTVEDIYNHCYETIKYFDLFEEPQIRVIKIKNN